MTALDRMARAYRAAVRRAMHQAMLDLQADIAKRARILPLLDARMRLRACGIEPPPLDKQDLRADTVYMTNEASTPRGFLK